MPFLQRHANRAAGCVFDGGDDRLHYYFSDHLGTHGVVENATGTQCEQDIDYYPYGGQQNDYCTTPVAQNYKFNGKERDGESGLDNFGARYDTSNLGRWMTPDWAEKPTTVPYANFGNPQSLNLYSYVENNPTTFGDPDGHGRSCNDYPGLCAAIRDAVSSGKSLGDGVASYLSSQGTINTNPPTPNAAVAQLVVAQDNARANPNFAPVGKPGTSERKTFCNVACRNIAANDDATTAPLQGTANQISNRLSSGAAGSHEAPAGQVIGLANQGKLVVGVQPHKGHGHIVTARPTVMGFGSTTSVNDPPVNNIGGHIGVMPASDAFYATPAVHWYTIDQNP